MTKANEPAYPLLFVDAEEAIGYKGDPNGLTKREKLAMEIYVALVAIDGGTESWVIESAKRSLRAADIFFEQLNK